MVYTGLAAETAAVSCGTSHVNAVNTTSVDIQNVEPHASAVSLLKRAENSAI